MNTYRLALGVTTVALALSGCGFVGGARDTSALGDRPATPEKSPREVLIETVPDEKVGAYTFDIKGGMSPFSGLLDAPNRTAQVKVTHAEDGVSLTLHALIIKNKSWMKLSVTGAPEGFPRLPKKWMLIDPKKIKDPDDAPLSYNDDEIDPGYTELIIRNSQDVVETGKGRYAGTTDLTGAKAAEIVDEKTLTALGEQAKSVPFDAVVGPEGHLTSLTVKIPATGGSTASTYKVTYAGYGRTKTPTVPAETSRPTATVYELLNS
ncbi:hypothetical protein Ade02nite_22830 [Paractinoplanes deccanensis]|uniref:Lipoprotein n=1 Tax=Paractinoplanes deccanensis TaxID=113561 RepID=A0ABQ3Y0Z5_9ACTN|nr:hypothetical protein [Actinoplanes deccanensis]GID73642.1 hypothetical protein Ade02nite_22830 [Actinoplanes deccanensis]